MTRPKVSVIVPVYKVEPYIEKCARSLFEQTLDELEILFIDDCSPDNSTEMILGLLREYPNRKSQTKILSMASNSGSAAVRAKGMKEANGLYVIHCDGDDWVDKDLYRALYEEAIRTDADIVVCDEVLEYTGYSVAKPTETLPHNGKQLMKDWYKNIVGLFCHNKLVRRSLYVENQVYPWFGLNMWEDNGLFARLFYYARRVTQINGGPVYHYNRANVNAMTSGYGLGQVEQMLGIADRLAHFFGSKPDASDFKETTYAFKYLARINLVTDSFANYRRFIHTFPESKYIATELDLRAFSSKGKLRFQMVKHGLGLIFVILFKAKNLISRG